ncbi:MAG: tryptophan synthase subunit alpha [Deltaproteobacteria bacterium]|nr:tryptophan synthase subunit alpha [Deltaproteobacteria bacterium]
MALESYIRNKKEDLELLIMTHIVIGYPSLEKSFKIVESMVDAGVDLIELQVPFSEPMADGPVILHANEAALDGGITVEKCLDFSRVVAHTFDIPFLIMSYYNIPFRYGLRRFVGEMANRGLKGAIIPDLPPEEGEEYLDAMKESGIDPVLIFSPNTTDERMSYIASLGRGFIYCVARRGVTGATTDFSGDMDKYLERCRKASRLPLAVGFGVKEKADIDFLKGKADIAVIGSQVIRVIRDEGTNSVGPFLGSLL